MVGAERGCVSAVVAERYVCSHHPLKQGGTLMFSRADEPEEVAVVKKALIQHLEFDSKVTLGVLCDQIVPTDEPMEDEDKSIRDRLRALVVAFLAEDARQPLLAQLQRQGRGAAEQEEALIDTLIKVLQFISPLHPPISLNAAPAGGIQIRRSGHDEDHRGHTRFLALVQRRSAHATW